MTGSAKGSEERDIMFGKLFAYVSMIRAGLIHLDNLTSHELLERLIALHNKKNWLQELTIETILSLIAASEQTLQVHILSKIEPFYNHPFSEMNVNQLLLFCGLQLIASNDASFQKIWKTSVQNLHLQSFELTRLNEVAEPLLASSRKFPKVILSLHYSFQSILILIYSRFIGSGIIFWDLLFRGHLIERS